MVAVEVRFNPPPGWPVPREGWTPPANWRPDPSWPEPPRGWELWTPVAPVLPARSPTTRVVLTVAMYAAWLALHWLVTDLVLGADPTSLDEARAQDDRRAVLAPGLYLADVALVAWLCTKVSYRWFDGLLMLVPFYNLWLMGKILWRVSLLPQRDWALRPDEDAATAPPRVSTAAADGGA